MFQTPSLTPNRLLFLLSTQHILNSHTIRQLPYVQSNERMSPLPPSSSLRESAVFFPQQPHNEKYCTFKSAPRWTTRRWTRLETRFFNPIALEFLKQKIEPKFEVTPTTRSQANQQRLCRHLPAFFNTVSTNSIRVTWQTFWKNGADSPFKKK